MLTLSSYLQTAQSWRGQEGEGGLGQRRTQRIRLEGEITGQRGTSMGKKRRAIVVETHRKLQKSIMKWREAVEACESLQCG